MITTSANEKWTLTKAELMRTGLLLCDLLAHSFRLLFSHWLSLYRQLPPLPEVHVSGSSACVWTGDEKQNTSSERDAFCSEGSKGAKVDKRDAVKESRERDLLLHQRGRRETSALMTKEGRFWCLRFYIVTIREGDESHDCVQLNMRSLIL